MMGIDITIMAEIRPNGSRVWHKAKGVRQIMGRSYDLFGCLFGVQNYAHFTPIAAERGIPDDASIFGDELVEQGYFSPTWIAWTEIQAIDWDELAELPDSRIHQYRRDEQGNLVYSGKSAWNRAFAEQVGHSMLEGLFGARTWQEGQEWEIDGTIYRSERLRRRDVLSQEWEDLFATLAILAARYGDENVRLLACFYS